MPGPAIIPVTDLADPRLAPFVSIREKQLKEATASSGDPSGLFLAEGELVVSLLLRSPYRVRSVLLSEARLSSLRATLDALPAGTPVFVAPPDALRSLVGFNLHRGVLACAERGTPRTLDDLLAEGHLARGAVVLEDLTNHDNVGAIFRNAGALAGPGVGVVLSPRCCDPLYRKAVRVSMGHVLRTPFAVGTPWPEALRVLRSSGMTVLALTPDPGAEPIDALAARPPRRPALLLGSEGPGLTREALDAADARVRIPQAPGADSLNVGVACAIALHRLLGPETPGVGRP